MLMHNHGDLFIHLLVLRFVSKSTYGHSGLNTVNIAHFTDQARHSWIMNSRQQVSSIIMTSPMLLIPVNRSPMHDGRNKNQQQQQMIPSTAGRLFGHFPHSTTAYFVQRLELG